MDRRIALPVSEYVKTVDKTMASLVDVARLVLRHSHQFAQEKRAANDPPDSLRIFLFLDGLDESKDGSAFDEILRLFDNQGVGEVPLVQKVWISSRETYALKQRLSNWPFISADDLAETDVNDFLSKAVPRFDDSAESSKEVDGMPRKRSSTSPSGEQY